MTVSISQMHVEDLASYMRQQQFSNCYIEHHIQICQFISKRISRYSWDTFDDVRSWIQEQDYQSDYKKQILRIVSDIEYFSLFGRLPNDSNYQGDNFPGFVPLPDDLSVFMHEHGYCETYIAIHLQLIRTIIRDAKKYSWTSISDVCEWYRSQNYSPAYVKYVAQILENIQYFHNYGRLRGNGVIMQQYRIKESSKGSLDLSFWNDHLDELVTFMRDNDYSKHYIRILCFICRKITVASRSVAWDSYAEIFNWFQAQKYAETYISNIRSVLGVLEAFHIRGEVPNNRLTQSVLCLKECSFTKLTPSLQEIVNAEVDLCKEKGLAYGTIRSRWSAFSVFLYAMQSRGAETLSDITGDMISDFFHEHLQNHPSDSMSKKLSLIFSELSALYPYCATLRLFIPKVQLGRKNIQYVTQDEALAFENVILNENSHITLKSRAIGTLLYYTGVRSSDIINLQIEDVDLSNSTISFYQKKTGNAALLPLLPVVGNAIIDYCLKERPMTDSAYLFVGNSAPHHPLGVGAVYSAIESIMAEANIRRNAGDRKGAHIFRHRIATTLLENNVPTAVISSVMGHSSPNSLNSYLYADMKHLKECALSISAFPLPEEVFNYV